MLNTYAVYESSYVPLKLNCLQRLACIFYHAEGVKIVQSTQKLKDIMEQFWAHYTCLDWHFVHTATWKTEAKNYCL